MVPSVQPFHPLRISLDSLLVLLVLLVLTRLSPPLYPRDLWPDADQPCPACLREGMAPLPLWPLHSHGVVYLRARSGAVTPCWSPAMTPTLTLTLTPRTSRQKKHTDEYAHTPHSLRMEPPPPSSVCQDLWLQMRAVSTLPILPSAQACPSYPSLFLTLSFPL